MPWRSVQDELGKCRWIYHEGRVYQSRPYAAEQNPTEKNLFVVSMMHANLVKYTTTAPDVTCPGDVVDKDCRDEVVRREETPGQPKKQRKSKDDKKSTFTVKAKSTAATPSIGPVRE